MKGVKGEVRYKKNQGPSQAQQEAKLPISYLYIFAQKRCDFLQCPQYVYKNHIRTVSSQGPFLYYVSKRTEWVGSEKWQFLLTFSTIYAEVEWEPRPIERRLDSTLFLLQSYFRLGHSLLKIHNYFSKYQKKN